jgi:hypothetical protein
MWPPPPAAPFDRLRRRRRLAAFLHPGAERPADGQVVEWWIDDPVLDWQVREESTIRVITWPATQP